MLEWKDMINFLIYIQDPEFDNEDNEYIEIKLHKKTNMIDQNDYKERIYTEIKDEIIPIKVCTGTDYEDEWSSGSKIYCPDYRENDFLFGDYYSEK